MKKPHRTYNIIPNKLQILVVTLLGIVPCLAISGKVQADVFQATDAMGVIHLSNVPTDDNYALLIRDAHSCTQGITHADKPARSSKSDHFRVIVTQAAQEQNLDQALLQAIIATESGYDPHAISSDGAVGLMQLMPKTAKRYGVKDRKDPEQNIRGGAAYLHDLMQQFHNNLPLVLAAYNAGEDAVVRHGNRIPPYAETRRYVPRVLSLYHRYRTASP